MIKRRFAVLGTVAVLALTGLGGSALASEDAPKHVTCTTADGKTVELELIKALPATPAENGEPGTPQVDKWHRAEPGTVVPAKPAEPGQVKPGEEGEVKVDVRDADGAAVRAVPARPATTVDGAPIKVKPMETISCVQSK